MEENRFDNYYRLPPLVLKIMNWLCTTRFYQKTFLERKKYFNEIQENWKFCDFVVLDGSLENPKTIKIGNIPRYKGDHEKSIVINFKNKESCFLIRGYATGLYASKVIKNVFPVPQYMISDLYEFIEEAENI